ncbi:hypothetical protein ACC723_38365, partial [Rhizobium ruizarguesonis]
KPVIGRRSRHGKKKSENDSTRTTCHHFEQIGPQTDHLKTATPPPSAKRQNAYISFEGLSISRDRPAQQRIFDGRAPYNKE